MECLTREFCNRYDCTCICICTCILFANLSTCTQCAHQLFCITPQSSRIVRVPTINFTASGQEDLIEMFEVEGEGAITDTAIDALNG